MNRRYFLSLLRVIICVLVAAGSAIAPAATTTAPTTAPAPFTLRDCILYALQNSPELERKDIIRRNQKLNTTIERAVFDPVLNSGPSWANNRPSTTQPAENKEWDYNAGVTKKFPWGVDLSSSIDEFDTTRNSHVQGSYSVRLSKQILGGGSLTESMSKINTSIFNELIYANDVNREKRRIVFIVKRQFYQTVRAMQTLVVQEHILERAKQNLTVAVEREDPLDIENARAEIPAKETEVIRAQREIRAALDQLKVLIGLKVGDPFGIIPEFEFIPADVHLDKDIDYALKNHEDVLNSGLRTQILQIDAKVTRERTWPDLFLYAEHRDGVRNVNDYLVSPGQTIGVLFSYPIGERADRARHEQARNRLIDESLQLYQITQDLTRNIRDQARGLNELRESIRLQERHVQVRERILELYRDRYESGEIDILEYIRSQNDLERVRVDLIGLKTNYMGVLAEYNYTTAKQ